MKMFALLAIAVSCFVLATSERADDDRVPVVEMDAALKSTRFRRTAAEGEVEKRQYYQRPYYPNYPPPPGSIAAMYGADKSLVNPYAGGTYSGKK